MWITLILCFCLFGWTRTHNNDILGFDLPTVAPLDINSVCKSYPGLSQSQYEICTRHPDVAASAIQGVQIAIHECQHQFKLHRWNCSVLETKNKNPHSSPILSRGFKETAFAHAIMAAGMITQVSRACAMGKLTSCGCKAPQYDQKTRVWHWDGCENNMHFGEKFTRRFLDSKEEGSRDLLSQMHLHNNRAGRMLIKQSTRKNCKCHGISGTCEIKTCWEDSPPIRQVGDQLKQHFKRAIMVDNSNSARGKLQPLHTRRKTVHKRDLVYFENSPNFCEHDASLDSHGTSGRYCNSSSSGIDNCETMCCGRGYATLQVTRTERCFCQFHWCCYVRCQECKSHDWVTVCK